MKIENSINLRPRFKESVSLSKEDLLSRMDGLQKQYKQDYRFVRSEEHIWIHYPKQEAIFTPHLHLEIVDDESKQTMIKGLYSPNSAYWTLFMFLHFILATLFIALGIIAYSKSVMDDAYSLYLYLMLAVTLIWIGLYFFARYNRKKGLPQAYELEKLFQEWIKET
jgi:hypothetical protein